MRIQRLVQSLAIVFFASFGAAAYASPVAGDAGAFITALAHKGLSSGSDKTLSASDRQQAFQALVDENFDLPWIARFVLGHYWRQTNDADRQEFTAVFRDTMVRAYTQRFTDYRADSFRVVGERAEGATSAMVDTEITRIATGQVINLVWRLNDNNGYRVIDMSVGGVSMAIVKRDEISSILGRSGGDVQGLIRQMRGNAQSSR